MHTEEHPSTRTEPVAGSPLFSHEIAQPAAGEAMAVDELASARRMQFRAPSPAPGRAARR